MIQSSLESPKHWRMRPRGPSDPRPIPEGVHEPICIHKKQISWTRWRPVPVENVNYQRPPSSRRSGLSGSRTTPTIVDYKDMASTPREGCFGAAHARDVNICIWTSRKSIDHERNDRAKVHGDGTRADGRRSVYFAKISEIVGSRPSRAARSIVGSQAM